MRHRCKQPKVPKLNSELFKEFKVETKCAVKKFTEAQGLEFVKGKVYYQLVKKETVQDYKNVVVKRRSDGECVIGDAVKPLLNITKGKLKLDTEDHPDFDIFIQSTSYNRNLDAGTTMLYQIKDLDAEDVPPPSPAKAVKRPAKADTKEEEPKKAKKAAAGGATVDVVFSFDTTGSMYACLAEVRRGVKEAISRLKKEVPGIRIAIIAHGDYCDAR